MGAGLRGVFRIANLTHTLTHTGKRTDGNNGAKSAADLILLEQKWLESVENQGLKGSQSVGKDEVGSSNLPSSSKNPRELRFSRIFCFLNYMHHFGRGKRASTIRAHQIGSGSCPVRFFLCKQFLNRCSVKILFLF